MKPFEFFLSLYELFIKSRTTTGKIIFFPIFVGSLLPVLISDLGLCFCLLIGWIWDKTTKKD